MMLPDVTAIRRAMTPAAPTLEQLDELIACAGRRIERAYEKVLAAEAEHDAAMVARASALASRARFLIENPDPQLSLLPLVTVA